MKKLIILIIALITALAANAQITEEYTYNSSNIYNPPTFISTKKSFIDIVKLETSGEKYAFSNYYQSFDADLNKVLDSFSITLYNLDYSFYKEISVDITALKNNPNIPIGYNLSSGYSRYISEKLFNNDNGVEFMFSYEFDSSYYYFEGVAIIDENGTAIFNELYKEPFDNCIKNTANGTKMILYTNVPSGDYGVKIYSLPGTYSGKKELKTNGFDVSASPNPAQSFTNISYELPEGISEGTLTIFNMNGNKVKEYKVGSHFNSIKVSTSELTTGSYLYQVTTSKGLSQGRKLIVIQ